MNRSISNFKAACLVTSLFACAAVSSAQQHDQSFMQVDQGLTVAHRHAPMRVVGYSSIREKQTHPKKKDASVHHAAMHAEHWLDHHTSAPHGKAYQHRAAKRKHDVNHAVKHTEHWIDHHVSAPHKHPGGK